MPEIKNVARASLQRVSKCLEPDAVFQESARQGLRDRDYLAPPRHIQESPRLHRGAPASPAP